MGSATFKIPIEMTGATSSSSGGSGLVPPPVTGDEDKFLKGDGTWGTLSDMIGTDGTNDGASGAVPAPIAGEENYFLRGDGTWAEPDSPVIPEMTGATSSSDGESGLVPTPYSGDETKFLAGDGIWSDLPEMSGADSSYDGTGGMVPAPLMGEENMFLRGDGTWATLYEMTGATSSTDGESGAVPAPLTGEEDYFLKGDGTWSAVDASPMVGATDSTDGEGGTVPAPLTGEEDAFLRGDGTWAYPDSGLPFPSDISPLANDGTYLYLVTADNGDISSEFIDSEMTGATSSTAGTSGLVPAPSAGDEDKFLAGDGTYKSGGLPMVILSYGSSTWAEFEAAYNNNVIVYCRASSNSNPASGSQTRMAFMAYVNNATTPTEVEFQYYRSMSSHSATAMGDQVFVYKLTKTGGWSVTTRDASIKQIKADTGTALGVSWSSNVVTLTNTMTAADMPMSSSDATTVSSAIANKVSGPSSVTNNRVAVFDGTTGKVIKDSGYTIAKSVPSDANFTNTWRGIQNNLTSTSTTDSLSAAQGKVLKDTISSLVNQYVIGVSSLGSNAYMDKSYTFPKTFSTIYAIFAVINTTSTSGDYGSITASVISYTNTSATVRFYSGPNHSSARDPQCKLIVLGI